MSLEFSGSRPVSASHTRCLVRACRDDVSTIHPIRRAVNAVPMAYELSEQAPGVRFPYARRLVPARGDDAAAVGLNVALDGVAMALELEA